MERKKLTLLDLFTMKTEKRKIVLISVPDATTAHLAERAGVDIVVVGNSLAMVLLGYPTTTPLTMDDVIRLGQAVRRGAPNTFMLSPLPYQSYQTPEMALHNAARLMQEAGADAVKIQGGVRVKHILKAIIDAGIPCASHVGLTTHTIAQLGGFKVQARGAEGAMRVYEDALAIQEAGGFGMEIEAVPPPVAEQITRDVDVITWGIGAGPGCDGQTLIGWDMLGFYDRFKPKFVKRYANLAETVVQAFSKFSEEVREGDFPTEEYTYSVDENEMEKFMEIINERKGTTV
jgi:3-methyl-2-oxobutanoate hydroxymethyltransferase